MAEISPFEFSKVAASCHLDSIEPEIAPFDLPKTPPKTKHEVDRMTGCRDIAIRNFRNETSVRRSVVDPGVDGLKRLRVTPKLFD